MSTETPAVETADTLAREVLLPSPANGARCDADKGEAAVARVYTKTGPLDFCGHHLRENMAIIAAVGYEVAYSDPELDIDPYPQHQNWI
jgi:hypothetical protein